MTPPFITLKLERLRRLSLIAAGALAVIVAADPASAASRRGGHSIESIESRAAGDPVMAIVSLRSQRVTIFDAAGWILRAPVSSGQRGRETPAGVFSVIEKQAEHYSNLYDDASMPHMQRITWSGIALHGGPLPGHPASHGCIRMPYGFAEHLFDLTRLGMRVIVAPRDVAPAEIAHPVLLQPNPQAAAAVAARSAEAAEATRKADEARLAAVAASRDAAKAMMPVRVAENMKRRAEAELAAAERALAAASADEEKAKAEDARTKAAAKVSEQESQLAAAKADLQPKLDAVAPAREAAAVAEAARAAAVEAARKAARELEPVSVFVSRKTQRLYVRQGFQPILESPVTILDPDRPIGTHVFTAMARSEDGKAMRWSVVSLAPSHTEGEVAETHARGRKHHVSDVEVPSTDTTAAKAALDRITIAPDVLDRIGGMASPRSSLIVSDEALSPETGKGTEFVVVMSDEPQGGLKMRRRGAPMAARYERWRARRSYWRSPYYGPFSTF